MLVTGLGIQCFQQITGIDALVYYSPTIFRDAGITTESQLLAATVAVGFFKTAFIALAIVLIDRVGRKPLLYVSTIGMTVCLVILSAALFLLAHGLVSRGVGIAIAILTVCGDVAFFSIFPLRLRAQAAALGAVANRVTSGAVAMSFLSICRAISVAGAFSAFAAISALSVVFVHRFVPETSGKTLEQIESLFGGGGDGEDVDELELGDVEQLELRRVRPIPMSASRSSSTPALVFRSSRTPALAPAPPRPRHLCLLLLLHADADAHAFAAAALRSSASGRQPGPAGVDVGRSAMVMSVAGGCPSLQGFGHDHACLDRWGSAGVAEDNSRKQERK
ncbi:hypothetical protein HU200_058032 [Digitaria exilis]|uniref:Major facilitator superfamily (MFS) profile domain-containing protein n=1 Tax=Digitaria exilis TaxID=1010633 RepID=A0A835E3T0_9POAL|nr:hypothetical protein HU200_058032 [Digitaria exilis]